MEALPGGDAEVALLDEPLIEVPGVAMTWALPVASPTKVATWCTTPRPMRSIIPNWFQPALHGDHPVSIDALDVAHAADQQVQGRGAPRHEEAVDDLALLLLADGDGNQADLSGEGQHPLEHVRFGAGVAHDLADVAVPHADGEVEGEEPLRPVEQADERARRGALTRCLWKRCAPLRGHRTPNAP